nr:hypothetical protein [Propionibacterium acidifaciens]
MRPKTAPWVALMIVRPAGIPKKRAMAMEIASEMSAHQWVLTLNTPMRMKKAARGTSPTRAVR